MKTIMISQTVGHQKQLVCIKTNMTKPYIQTQIFSGFGIGWESKYRNQFRSRKTLFYQIIGFPDFIAFRTRTQTQKKNP